MTTLGTQNTLDTLLASAINTLRREVSTSIHSITSHTLTVVNIEKPEVIDAFALYALVAGIGCGIRMNLEIATDLLGGGPDFSSELVRQVYMLLGEDNNIDQAFREGQRNPWFTECLGHALLKISSSNEHLASPGDLEALTHVHLDVRDHGLDLVGLYFNEDAAGINITEAKASENNASQHGSATATLFAEIDGGVRDFEIMRTVQHLREALSQERQGLITSFFWHRRRVYFAVISYSDASQFTPSRRRSSYASLSVPPHNIKLLAVPLQNYHQYFDEVADKVRSYLPMVIQAGARI